MAGPGQGHAATALPWGHGARWLQHVSGCLPALLLSCLVLAIPALWAAEQPSAQQAELTASRSYSAEQARVRDVDLAWGVELVGAFLLQGNVESALPLANELLASHPDSWLAHRAWVRAVMASGASWRLRREYSRLAMDGQPLHQLMAAWVEALLGESPSSLDGLEQMASDSRYPRRAAGVLWAELLLERGDDETALQALQTLDGPEPGRLSVQALMALERSQLSATRAVELLRQYPRRPDVAVGLWDSSGKPSRSLRAARRRAVSVARGLVESGEEPRALFHAWELLATAREGALARDASRALGALVPGLDLPPRLPLTSTLIRDLGSQLARTGGSPDLLDVSQSDARALSAVRARTLAEDGELAAALEAFRQALAMAPRDWALLSQAAEAELKATTLSQGSLGDPARALDLARMAAAALGALVEPGIPSRPLAHALQIQARALVAMGRREDALAALVSACALQPDPASYLLLASLQLEFGLHDSAVASLASAAALGNAEGRWRLAELYEGPADYQALVAAAADTLGIATAAPGSIDVEEPSPESSRPRGPMDLIMGVDSGTSGVGAQPRVLVVAFWASWCRPCLQELPGLANLASQWSVDGLGAEVTAVSLDQEEAPYRRARRKMGITGIRFKRLPEVAAELGINSVPITWILDSRGEIRGRYKGYAEKNMKSLDRLVRELAEEQQ